MKARTLPWVTVIALLAIVGMALGCAHKTDDARITSTIQSSFNADSGLQGKQLGVQSENGVVTLSGAVDTDAQRTAAARYAAAAPGVKEVVNNLQVSAPMDAAQEQPMQSPAPEAAAEPPARKPSPSRHHSHSARAMNDSPDQYDSPQQIAQADAPAAPAPAAQPEMPAPPLPPPPPPPTQKVTIPSGSTVSVRLVDPLGSDISQQGQTFQATLSSPLTAGGEVAVPMGYDVEGHVVSVENGGKFTGKAQLTLQLDRIKVGSRYYNLDTDQYHRETKSRTTNTVEKVGAGSVIGAIIGGIAGGGKGAAIGAAAGGGVGGGAQAASKAPQVKLPSETVLTFTLQSPLTVIPTSKSPRTEPPRLNNDEQN